MKPCTRCGGQLLIEGDDLSCLQCGYNEPRMQNRESEEERKCAIAKRGIRYSADVKRAALADLIRGEDKYKICERVGCEISTLTEWAKKYGPEEAKVLIKKRRARRHLYPEPVKIQAVRDLESGEDWKAILERVGCSYTALMMWRTKYESAEATAPETTAPETPSQPTPPRHPNGTLDFTEEERLAILEDCRKLGIKATSKKTGVNRSTLNRWRRCLNKTGYTLQSENPQVSTYTDHIGVLRELQSTLTTQWYDLGRQIEAVTAAIDILVEKKRLEVIK